MIKGTIIFFHNEIKILFPFTCKDRPHFTLTRVISLLIFLYVQNLIAKIGRAEEILYGDELPSVCIKLIFLFKNYVIKIISSI